MNQSRVSHSTTVTTPGISPARDAVARRVAMQIGRFPDLAFGPFVLEGADHRDQALAQAIYAETIRRWMTLEALVQSRLDRPLEQTEPKMRAALMVGAAQLYFFGGLPDYAVVDEMVEWAGRRIRTKARGMVNAVLRRLIELRGEVIDRRAAVAASGNPRLSLPLSDGRIQLLNDSILPESRIERLAAQTSHPRALVERWSKRFGDAEAERLLHHNLIVAPTIIALSDAVAAAGGAAMIEMDERLQPHERDGFAVWIGDHAGLLEFLAANPGARVQDPASAAVVDDLRDLEPPAADEVIADLCAGLGTKTEQLALAFPEARLVASDTDPERYATLERRFAGHERVSVVPKVDLIEYAGQAALILLDVPCSNTGVLARRVEAKYRVEDASIKRLVDIQRQIIADSLVLRSPRGRIVYSTCSMEPEENERQIQWLGKWHDLRPVRERHRAPAALPGDPASVYSDGGYHAIVG